jgi:hypothetical protein
MSAKVVQLTEGRKQRNATSSKAGSFQRCPQRTFPKGVGSEKISAAGKMRSAGKDQGEP